MKRYALFYLVFFVLILLLAGCAAQKEEKVPDSLQQLHHEIAALKKAINESPELEGTLKYKLGQRMFALQKKEAELGGVTPEDAPFLLDDPGNDVGILLIHGFTATPWEVKELGDHLFQRNITVWAPLLDGHATSPEDLQETSWQEWNELVGESYEGLGHMVDKVYVGGVSMGSVLSLALAANAQEKPAGIVAVSTPIYMKEKGAYFASFVESFVEYSAAAPKTNEEKGHYYEKIPTAAVAEMMELIEYAKQSMKNIHEPILIIQSLEDPRVESKSVDFIDREVQSRDKRIFWYSKGPHVIIRGDDKEEIFTEIAAFIDQTK